MAINQSLRRRLETAEDKLMPRDDDNSLQRRIDDFATRYQQGETDDRLSQYPSELFEPTPETLHEKPVEATLEAEAGNDTPRVETSPVVKDFTPTPLERFDYSEVKPGWTERIERRPDGSTIRHVSIDLTKIDPDEIDELDRPSWDWQPGPRPPSYRDVERMIKDDM